MKRTQQIRIILFFTYFTFTTFSFSQTNSEDSLIHIFTAADLNQKIELLSEIELVNVQKSIDLSLNLFNENLTDEQVDKLNEQLASSYYHIGDYENAILTNRKLIQTKTLSNDSSLHATYNELGKIYANKGEYDSSTVYFIKALEETERIKNKEGQAFYSNNVGIVFDLIGVYDKALEYYFKSLKIKEENGMTEALPASYTNIGIVYFNLEDYDNSIFYHQKALEGNINLNKTSSVATSKNNIGFAYVYKEDYKTAIKYLNEAYNLRKELEDTRGVAQTSINLARAYVHTNLDSANYYSNIGEELSIQLESNKLLVQSYEIHSEVAEKQQDFPLALELLKKQLELKEKINDADVLKSITELEAKYNLLAKENEINKKDLQLSESKVNLLQHRQIIQIMAIVSLVVFGLAVVLWFRNKHKKQVAVLLQGQLKLIESKNKDLTFENIEINEELDKNKELLDKIFTDKSKVELPPELLSLSKRETEVLSYLALGWTDQQLADNLFISKSTIKTHLKRIYNKLDVNGRAGAVAIAHQYNIIGTINDSNKA